MIIFDPSYIFKYWPQLFPYIFVTLRVTLLSLFLGVVLGGILAVWKVRRTIILKPLAAVYTSVIRCTPPLILLFIVYYGTSQIYLYIHGYRIPDISLMTYVVTAFTLLSAAMMSEVFRSAFEAVPKGQYEAALASGLSEAQAVYRIMLPQIVRIALPNFGNSLIGLFREGALAYNIGFIDLMGKANLISTSNFGSHTRELYIGLLIMYWIISIIFQYILKMIELKLTWGKSIGNTV